MSKAQKRCIWDLCQLKACMQYELKKKNENHILKQNNKPLNLQSINDLRGMLIDVHSMLQVSHFKPSLRNVEMLE